MEDVFLMCFPAKANAEPHAVKLRVQSGPRSLQCDMTRPREWCACTENQKYKHDDNRMFFPFSLTSDDRAKLTRCAVQHHMTWLQT